jgi:extradiol dioxygenase family protein
MTPHQIKVLAVLNESSDWFSIADLVNKTGIQNSVMHKLMKSDCFEHVEKSFIFIHEKKKRRLYIKIFRVNKQKCNVSQAYKLATEHTGIFGQLHWASKNKFSKRVMT